jgi:hypothetical protein
MGGRKVCRFGAAIREPDFGRIVLHLLGFCDDLTQKNRDSTASIDCREAAQLDATPDSELHRIAATVTILQQGFRKRSTDGHGMDEDKDGAACRNGKQALALFRYLRCPAI